MTVEPAETVLYGSLPDQSALFGLLVRIHDLGLQLLEVRRLTDDGTARRVIGAGTRRRRVVP